MSTIELLDLEDVEIVMDLERALGIKISDREARDTKTVGDLLALVSSKVSNVQRGDLPCPTAFAFRRLRAAVQEVAPGRKILTSTPLVDLLPKFDRRSAWSRIGDLTGFVLPFIPPAKKLPPPSILPFAMGIGAGFAAHLLSAGRWSFLIGMLAGVIGLGLDILNKGGQRSYHSPTGIDAEATVGDLATVVAALNMHTFVKRYGAVRQRDLMPALSIIIRASTGHVGPIDKRSRFKPV